MQVSFKTLGALFCLMLALPEGSRANTCSETLVKSIGFFDYREPQLIPVSVGSRADDAHSIGCVLGLYIKNFLDSKEKQLLIKYLHGESVSEIATLFPSDVIERLQALSESKRVDLLDLLSSSPLEVGELMGFFADLYSNFLESRFAYEIAMRSFDDFFEISRDLSDLISDGKINIDRLREAKLLRLKPEAPLFRRGLVPVLALRGIQFAITFDTLTKKYAMRLAPDVKYEGYFGLSNHAVTSRSSYVVYSGNLFLNMKAQVSMVNLKSGHFMYHRDSMIREKLKAYAGSPEALKNLQVIARDLDRKNIRDLFEKVFRLEFAESFPFKRQIFTGFFEWEQQFDKEMRKRTGFQFDEEEDEFYLLGVLND